MILDLVARQYWQDAVAALEAFSAGADPLWALSRYPGMFREALLAGNRMCMCSFMAAEYDELPDLVRKEVRTFADVNVAWLAATLENASMTTPGECESRGRAIYAAVAGAQLVARGRSDVALYDALIAGYRGSGPAASRAGWCTVSASTLVR